MFNFEILFVYLGGPQCQSGIFHCLLSSFQTYSRSMDELAYQLSLSDTLGKSLYSIYLNPKNTFKHCGFIRGKLGCWLVPNYSFLLCN